jgi:hypothetical protein
MASQRAATRRRRLTAISLSSDDDDDPLSVEELESLLAKGKKKRAEKAAAEAKKKADKKAEEKEKSKSKAAEKAKEKRADESTASGSGLSRVDQLRLAATSRDFSLSATISDMQLRGYNVTKVGNRRATMGGPSTSSPSGDQSASSSSGVMGVSPLNGPGCSTGPPAKSVDVRYADQETEANRTLLVYRTPTIKERYGLGPSGDVVTAMMKLLREGFAAGTYTDRDLADLQCGHDAPLGCTKVIPKWAWMLPTLQTLILEIITEYNENVYVYRGWLSHERENQRITLVILGSAYEPAGHVEGDVITFYHLRLYIWTDYFARYVEMAMHYSIHVIKMRFYFADSRLESPGAALMSTGRTSFQTVLSSLSWRSLPRPTISLPKTKTGMSSQRRSGGSPASVLSCSFKLRRQDAGQTGLISPLRRIRVPSSSSNSSPISQPAPMTNRSLGELPVVSEGNAANGASVVSEDNVVDDVVAVAATTTSKVCAVHLHTRFESHLHAPQDDSQSRCLREQHAERQSSRIQSQDEVQDESLRDQNATLSLTLNCSLSLILNCSLLPLLSCVGSYRNKFNLPELPTLTTFAFSQNFIKRAIKESPATRVASQRIDNSQLAINKVKGNFDDLLLLSSQLATLSLEEFTITSDQDKIKVNMPQVQFKDFHSAVLDCNSLSVLSSKLAALSLYHD